LWPPASISGYVLDESGNPIAGVSVRVLVSNVLNGRPILSIGNSVTTDARGEYRVTGLTPGEYVVAVPSTRRTMPAATLAAYREAQQRDDGSAAAMSNALARSGVRMPRPDAVTLGDLTFDPLVPAAPGAKLVYETTFYPGVSTPGLAMPIVLGAGDERTGVDLGLRKVAAQRVSGRVVDVTGHAVSNIGVHLLALDYPSFSDEAAMAAATAVSDASGAFTFLGVTAGEYIVDVLERGTADRPTRFAASRLTVTDRDIAGAALTLREGWRATGRVSVEGQTGDGLQTLLRQTRVSLRRVDGRSVGTVPSATPDDDGKFTTGAYAPGEYFVVATVTGGGRWSVMSAMHAGRDVADLPIALKGGDVGDIQIRWTSERSEIAGTVRTPQGPSDPESLVVAFPVNHSAWLESGANPRRFRQARPDVSGAFAISGLPPGDYFLIAVRDDSTSSPLKPDRYYASLAAVATKISLTANGRQTVTLTSRRVQ
jgi:hypothetical protein